MERELIAYGSTGSTQLKADSFARKTVSRGNAERTLALAEKISMSAVRCEALGQDRYHRTIAVCYKHDENLNDWMVRQGWALAYRKYSADYVEAEGEARQARCGVWQGQIAPPWEWRRR